MFDYYNPVMITVSQNGLVAMTDKNDSILIWRQRDEEIPPSGENGSIIAIIFNKFQNIKYIKWVFSSDYLAIQSEDEIIILDIYENKVIIKTHYTEKPYFLIYRDEIFVIFSTSNRIKYFNKDINWDLQPLKGMVWLENEYIANKSVRYDISDTGIVKEERGEQNYDRKIKRRLKRDSEVEPSELYAFSPSEFYPEEFILPDSYLHHLRNQRIITILFIEECIIFQTPQGLLFSVNNANISPLFIPESKAVVIPYALHSNIFAVITPVHEYQIRISDDQIKIFKLRNIISNYDLNLNNTIISFLIDSDLDLGYSKMNVEYGYLWLDDLSEYHLFLDLLTNRINFVSNSIHRQNVDIFVNENGTFILEWEKGNGYPEGFLQYREIEDINNPIILYDVDNVDPIGNFENEVQNSEIDKDVNNYGSLVIPAWRAIELRIIYQKQSFGLSWSKSSIFILMDNWSKLDYLIEVEMEDTYPLDFAFLKFCDLKINWQGKLIPFESISPYYILNEDLGRIITYSIDQYLYVWDLKTSVPTNRVKTNLPVRILESRDGKYLGIVSFDISEIDILPASDESRTILTKYPHILLQVIDLNKNKSYLRKYPFPTHLIDTDVKIEHTVNKFFFTFPSYIDKKAKIVISFDLKNSKFSLNANTEITQFWKSHTQGLDSLQINIGNEFPVNPHPEIDRDAVKQKFIVIDEGLYRKSDGECYISVFTHQELIKQKSNNEVLSHQGKFAFEMPFSGGKYRSIYLEKDKFEKIKDQILVKLDNMVELPKLLEATTVVTKKSDVFIQRLEGFLNRLIESNVIHQKDAILYYSNDFNEFQKSLKPLIDRVEKRTKKKPSSSNKAAKSSSSTKKVEEKAPRKRTSRKS